MFGYNYSKPGKGIAKPDPDQPRFVTYFEYLFRKLWNICKLNMLYLILGIPLFILFMFLTGLVSSNITNIVSGILPSISDGQFNNTSFLALFDIFLRFISSMLLVVFLGYGPITAGYTFVLRNFSRDEHAYIFSDLKDHAKANFKQSLIVLLVDIVFFVLITIAYNFYSSLNSAAFYLKYILIYIVLVYVIMHFYIYQIMVTFKLPLRAIYKNAFIYTFAFAPKNLAILIFMGIVHLVIPYLILTSSGNLLFFVIYILADIFVLMGASAFTSNFFVYSTIEKAIEQAEEIEETENTDK